MKSFSNPKAYPAWSVHSNREVLGGVNSNPLWVMTSLSAVELYLKVEVCGLGHVEANKHIEPG